MFRPMALCVAVLLAIVSPARGQDAKSLRTNVSLPVVTAFGVNSAQDVKSFQAKVLAMLEASGEPYSKVQDSVWAVTYKGKHAKSFEVRVFVVEDLAVFHSKIADRTDFQESADLFQRFLKFNNDVDSAKIAFLGDEVIVRLDMHVRLLDGEEWKYALSQVASAIDEAVGLFTKDLKRETPVPER